MNLNLSQSDRAAIAEFIYSYQTDVLIKSDALTLIDVLVSHKLINDPEKWIKGVNDQDALVVNKMLAVLDVIPDQQKKDIMNEYYRG